MTPNAARLEPLREPPIAGTAAVARPRSVLGPFLIGTAVGGLLGALAGTLLSDGTRRLLVWLIHLADRRLSDAEREQLRFELLLQ